MGHVRRCSHLPPYIVLLLSTSDFFIADYVMQSWCFSDGGVVGLDRVIENLTVCGTASGRQVVVVSGSSAARACRSGLLGCALRKLVSVIDRTSCVW